MTTQQSPIKLGLASGCRLPRRRRGPSQRRECLASWTSLRRAHLPFHPQRSIIPCLAQAGTGRGNVQAGDGVSLGSFCSIVTSGLDKTALSSIYGDIFLPALVVDASYEVVFALVVSIFFELPGSMIHVEASTSCVPPGDCHVQY